MLKRTKATKEVVVLPVYVVRSGSRLPTIRPCYVIGGNGVFLLKETGLVKAMVEVKGVTGLEIIKPMVELKIPQIPNQLAIQILAFFKAVEARHRTEAIVLLHFSPEHQEYRLVCPKQTVSHSKIEQYDASERIAGYQLVGTVHSHASFAADHSSIDDADEQNFDGLHVTLGHVNRRFFSISCSIMVNGNRFIIEPAEVIEGIGEIEINPKSKPNENSLSADTMTINTKRGKASQTRFCTLEQDPANVQPQLSFPKEWLEKVVVTNHAHFGSHHIDGRFHYSDGREILLEELDLESLPLDTFLLD